MSSQFDYRQIEREIHQALSKFGVPGKITIAFPYIILKAPEDSYQLKLPDDIAEVAVAPTAIMEKRCWTIAADLAAERRKRLGPLQLKSDNWAPFRAYAFWGVLGLIAIFAVREGFRYYQRSQETTIEAVAPAAVLPSSDHNCRATARRLADGARLDPSDSEGWEVVYSYHNNSKDGLAELLVEHPGNPQLHALNPKIDTDIAPYPNGATSVTSLREGSHQELILSGNYVRLYFDPAKRGQFYALASRLTGALLPKRAALRARCIGTQTSHIGSWFYGIDLHSSVNSLAETMLESDELADGSIAPFKDRSDLSALLSVEKGNVSQTDTGGTVISFPFHDAARSNRAARSLWQLSAPDRR